ncbi:MAG: 4-(cytidine 5'-diphospho)-2-C-methyl-D-erythritol kinase [Clostridiaceae bacterium]|nr:4-(cytidine 5'-diphospho)-2-C-methyl-D-erythritol kinase [Clostridiaceae bacterium]
MERIKLQAHAKINLSLDVTGKLENGYHTLQMIMQTISLCDEVILEKAQDGIEILCDDPSLPCDERNICHRAAKEFFEKNHIKAFTRDTDSKTHQQYTGVRIKIKKRIPVGAGLAGGSSNAAAVLKGLNILYGTNLNLHELAEIGLKCGADVPFCLYGGTCLAEGIGEKLTRLPSFADISVVLIVPEFSVSTEWVYKNYSLEDYKKHPDTKTLITAINSKDIEKVAREMVNVLESVTTVRYPEINEIKYTLKSCGALGSVMSGSGPSVFGLFENIEKARAAFDDLQKYYKQIYLVSTTDGGETYGENI